MSVKPARGFYRIVLSLVPDSPDSRLIGTSGAEIEVKVITQIAVEKVEIGVADKEQSAPSRMTKLVITLFCILLMINLHFTGSAFY